MHHAEAAFALLFDDQSVCHCDRGGDHRRATRRGCKVIWNDHSQNVARSPNRIEYLECLGLVRAIMLLPSEQRRVLLLASLTPRNYDEIASACHLPVGTVRSRLSRARAALRKLNN